MKSTRLPLCFLLVFASIHAMAAPMARAGQQFTLFYANDTLGETEPCG